MNDLTVSGFFTWSNEHMVTFTYWAPGTPKNHNGFSEDCVEMLHQVREAKHRRLNAALKASQRLNVRSAADWPLERRLLFRTQYLHLQNAQSTLPAALCEAHGVRMPPGWKDRRGEHTRTFPLAVGQ